MTESDWLQSRAAGAMVAGLCSWDGMAFRWRTSERKLRLFALACARRMEHRFAPGLVGEGFEAALRWLDGQVTSPQLEQTLTEIGQRLGGNHYPENGPERDAWSLLDELIRDPLKASIVNVPSRSILFWQNPMANLAVPAALLRDIVGNPFRPSSIDPAWLAWNDGTIPRMAKAMYDGRTFADLPILGDALEEAGCGDRAMLDHCRLAGPHEPGCWVVDLVLGKA